MNVRIRNESDGATLHYWIAGSGTCEQTVGGDETGPGERHLQIVSPDPHENASYDFTVGGTVTPGGTTADRANVREDGASATVRGAHDYTVTGTFQSFESEGAVTVFLDGEPVEQRALTSPGVEKTADGWAATGETDSEHVYEVDGDLTDFEAVGGDADWIVEVDEEPVAFGGPDGPLDGEFKLATRQQIRKFVECRLDEYVRRDEVEQLVSEELQQRFGETAGDAPDAEPTWEPIDDGTWQDRGVSEVPDGTGVLEVWSVEQGDLSYRIEGVGRAAFYDDPDDEKLDGSSVNDSIDNRDDGTFVIEGFTGNEYGDAYAVDGWVTAFEQTGGESNYAVDAGDGVDPLRNYEGNI